MTEINYYVYHIPGKKIGITKDLEKAELKINKVTTEGEVQV